MENTASKYLGKKVEGSTTYTPSYLTPVIREENRKAYGISEDNLPFCGYDIWHAYEFSALTENGIPVSKVIKIKYPCESRFIIESKSLKLYLNSFNMSGFGKTADECLKICKEIIGKDLSEVLKTDVNISFIEKSAAESFADYKNLRDFIDEKNFYVESYKEAPNLIKTEKNENCKSYRLMFDSLRSNCRVTHQPDFGNAYIYYRSKIHLDESSLFAYLASFRQEYHFHEECCEMIFKRLLDRLNPDDVLMVTAMYTRRGGIDICPVRYTANCTAEDMKNLADINVYTSCGIKQ